MQSTVESYQRHFVDLVKTDISNQSIRMSFGGNPPWQRNSLGSSNQQNAIASLQSQMMNSNFVGLQNLAMAQQAPQNNLALIPPIGGLNNSNPMFTNQHQTIPYQNARQALNPNAFGGVQNQQQIFQSQTNQNNQVSQVCNKIGTVTKFQNNGFGFIDDEIIFHKNTYKGSMPPNIGDRVLVEATYNSSSAFKWNATTVQPIANQNQSSSVQSQSQSRNNFPAFNSMSQSQTSLSGGSERAANPVRSSNHSSRQSSPPRRSSSDRNSRRDDEERRRRDKERERERERER